MPQRLLWHDVYLIGEGVRELLLRNPQSGNTCEAGIKSVSKLTLYS
jgi:hypothetical protein